jgi:diguanylate cyclase (GGDEF)-like protein
MSADVIFDGARIAALRDLELLDTGAEEDFDRYTRLVTELLDVPTSLVTLVDDQRQFFKSVSRLSRVVAEACQTPLSHSFCQHAVASQRPLVIRDAREHPLVADNLAVRDLDVIAYAGMPLVLSDGHAVGALCALDDKPRDWSARDLRILADLAAAVLAHLELRRSLAALTLHDRLTGLANRSLLCAHAGHLLQAAGPTAAGSVAAICIGMDNFGLVNQAYGAAVGDKLLALIGERLADGAPDAHMLGRLSGDTFTVVAAGVSDQPAAVGLAARLSACVAAEPFEVDGRRIGVTATVGVAIGMPGISGVDLLSRSDASLRRGKSAGGVVQIGPSGSSERAARQLQMRAALNGAIDRGEIQAVYQPIIVLEGQALIGFEALARWNCPELGPISPAEFIPAAERSGEIVRIGEWMLHTACAQLARWREQHPDLSISVNLAPLQLEVPNLPMIVEGALLEHGLPASALTLEITEGVLIGAGEMQARNLAALRRMGARVALDDFGTGYSALGYLTRFPIDQIKIDRSFVDGLQAQTRRAALVQAILTLAEGLELTVVAEGIETTGQRDLLNQMGCTLGQGYLFAAPRPAVDIGLETVLPARQTGRPFHRFRQRPLQSATLTAQPSDGGND